MSEIYYPHGWKLTIDGKPEAIKRANYLLRAVPVSKGKHRVEMHFDPETIHRSELLSYIAQALLLLGAIAWAALSFKKKQSI